MNITSAQVLMIVQYLISFQRIQYASWAELSLSVTTRPTFHTLAENNKAVMSLGSNSKWKNYNSKFEAAYCSSKKHCVDKKLNSIKIKDCW